MPCDSCHGMGESNNNNREIRLLKDEVNKVTRLMCELLHAIKSGSGEQLSQELMDWAAKHSEWDKKNGRTG